MKKKFLSLALALVMLLSLVACGGNNTPPANDDTPDTPPVEDNTPDTPDEPASDEFIPYTYDQDEVYDNVLGEFYDTYMKAFDAKTASERYALMAVAEAKMLSAGVMIPLTSQGGQYALRRNAYRSAATPMWGNDTDRFHDVVVTNEMVKLEDWNAMKTLWNELRGTGTYHDEVQKWLVEKGYTISDTYDYAYTSDPATWDALASQKQADSRAIIQTCDNLVEYNCENDLQPALAESWDINEDYTEFTFHIRQGVNWVDNQGREVAPVQADDWVAGYQHMIDVNKASALTINLVAGAEDYATGENTDFSTVGVEAVDQYTLKYTLSTSCPYFLTMLTYSTVAAPLCRSYYESHGGKFGLNEYDETAADYTYGKDTNNIPYCGPYLVTSHTEKSMIVFQANPSWWNADNLQVKTLNWRYNDGTDATKSYQDFKANLLTSCGLVSATLETAKAEGLYDGYNTVSETDSTSFVGFLNVNRLSFVNDNDNTKMVSTQSHGSADEIDTENGVYTSAIEDDAARTHVAMSNQNFRLALCLALDHAGNNAQMVGDELKLVSLRNMYTPGNFMYLDEETTIDINGTPTTFAAGTAYGEICQAQLDADGIPVKVWDPESGSSDGFDGWYNPTAAKEYLDKAVAELAESNNCEISAENPIYVDLPYMSTHEGYTNKAHSFKQSVEASTEGRIIVNLVGGDQQDWYDAGYSMDVGPQSNYDIYDLSGWGPDYGDPSTFLDTMLPDGNGYMAKCLGLY